MLIDECEFEGTLVMEKLSEIGELDAFYESIDSDNFSKAQSLMKKAKIDPQTIAIVLQKMSESNDDE